VLEPAPGLTQLSLLMVDYRDNDLGDYDEVGIVFFVKPRGAGDEAAGTYIHQLPVNQSFTCEAGCRIWGFPKSVEEIDFDYESDSATCSLHMDGRHVLTLTVPRGGDGTTDDTPSTGYTMIEGVPHTNVFTRGGSGEQTVPGGEGVRLELGDHRIADELRSLGLPDAAPLLSAWTEHMRGSFGPSEKL
ncbi:MAG: acetoacetate decarboxylase family protein, partial [Myxococcota bacterium]